MLAILKDCVLLWQHCIIRMLRAFILRIIYNLFLFIALLFYLPRLLRKKGRSKLYARLGFNQPDFSKKSAVRIWFHAVSVGEAKAVIPLVKLYRKNYPEASIVFSTVTETGLQEVIRSCPELDNAFIFPLDFMTRSYVKAYAPTLVILSETDFWYNFLDEAKRCGAKIILVNGKLSLKSLRFYRFFPHLFTRIDRFIVQAEVYKQRFLTLGIPEEKIVIGGNLKLDKGVLSHIVTKAPKLTLVIGSTHHPEEKLFLNVLKPLWESYPHLQVYLVPRHPERFNEVAKLIDSFQIPFARSSESVISKLILVDEMGKLETLYSEATLCAVAGSWTKKVGGHNILEPAYFSKPVVFGPYMHSQPDLTEQLLSVEGGIQVDEQDLLSTLDYLLQNPHQAKVIGERGKQLIDQSRGAIEKVYEVIEAGF